VTDRAATARACEAAIDEDEDARSRKAPGVRRMALAAMLATAMLALGAGSASAVIVQLGNGKPLSYQPLRGATALSVQPLASANLLYHGGPVMTSNTNYTFYWAPSGSPAYPAEYQSGVNQYLEDLADDSGGNQNVDSVATQYTNASSEAVAYDSHFAGAIVDTDPYPKNGCKKAAICLTDAQLQAELKTYITAHALPRDLAHEYFMLTPPGVEDCFEASGSECSAGTSAPTYCAYHGSFASGGGEIVYANDPFVTGVEGCDDGEHPNNKPSDGALQGGLSHEHNESITDPELNAWFGPEGEENGDKCRTFVASSEFGTPLGKAADGSRYNQLINGREYWYQQEWSNEGSICKQRLAVGVAQVTKLSPKAGLAAGGSSVAITGTGFTGASAVHFGATAATSFTVNSGSSITAIAPAGTSGSVDVTVTGPGGTSATTSADLYKYKPPTVTGVSPKTGPKAGGTSVTITGSGFALGAATTFKFAASLATSVNCSSTSVCTALTPPHAKAGALDVKAKVASFNSPKNAPADHFTYF
jgi:IPT/TIG domain